MERSMLEKHITISASCEEAASDAHGVAILTEWDEFKTVDFKKIYECMFKPAFMFDGRNIIDAKLVKEVGFDFYSIGKG
jgi:UDPglucose 6-dehydrogenase